MEPLSFIFSLLALGLAGSALFVALDNRRQLGSGKRPSQPSPAGSMSQEEARLHFNLTKHPSVTDYGSISQDYRIRATNVGNTEARHITLEFDSDEELFFQEEILRLLPYPSLAPNQYFELCTRIDVKSPKVLTGISRWQNENGTFSECEFEVSRSLVE